MPKAIRSRTKWTSGSIGAMYELYRHCVELIRSLNLHENPDGALLLGKGWQLTGSPGV